MENIFQPKNDSFQFMEAQNILKPIIEPVKKENKELHFFDEGNTYVVTSTELGNGAYSIVYKGYILYKNSGP